MARRSIPILLTAALALGALQGHARELVLVATDGAPLRRAPDAESPVVHTAALGLVLDVREESQDGEWLAVVLGEQRSYELPHEELYWVPDDDVLRASGGSVRVTLDLSVHEEPAGDLTNPVDVEEFVHGDAEPIVPFYLSAAYTSPGDRSCSEDLGICARVRIPGVSWTSPSLEASTRRRIEEAFGGRAFRPVLRLASDLNLVDVEERVFLVKTLTPDADCYPQGPFWTVTEPLRTETTPAMGDSHLSSFPLPVETLVEGDDRGEVQAARIVYLLTVTLEDGTVERLARRIVVGWPKCA